MAQTILFKKVPLLSDLPRNELDYLAATLQVVNLAPAKCSSANVTRGKPFYHPGRPIGGAAGARNTR